MTHASPLTNEASLPKTAPTPTPSTGPSPYNWGQITGGPQAVAFPAIVKLMEVMTELMNMYQYQNETQVRAQNTLALNSAQATIGAANAQASATFMQASTEFSGVGTSLLQMGLTSKFAASSQTELATASKTTSSLTAFEDAYKAATPATGSVGMAPAPAAATPPSPEVEARITALRAGNSSIKAIAEEDARPGSTSAGHTRAALAHMKAHYSEEFNNIAPKLSRAQDTASRAVNDANIGLQSGQNKAQMWTSAINNGVNGSLTAGQTYFQKDQGNRQAVSSLDQSLSQSSGSMASNSQGFIGQFYQEEMQALQMLQQLSANTRV